MKNIKRMDCCIYRLLLLSRAMQGNHRYNIIHIFTLVARSQKGNIYVELKRFEGSCIKKQMQCDYCDCCLRCMEMP